MESYDTIAKELSDYVRQYTDLIVTYDEDGWNSTPKKPKGLGSVTLVSFREKKYLITCRHVITHKRWFFSGAGKGTGQTINEKEALKCRSLKIVSESTDCDIAILSGYPDNPLTRKLFYPIEEFRALSYSKLCKECGTLCVSVGGLAKITEFMSWPDLLYANICYIEAQSSILSVTEDEITVDFGSNEVFDKRTDLFPKLKDFNPENGVIDMHGCSGCGLWGFIEKTPCLIGILRGRIEDNPDNCHIIRFTPVWKVLEILNSIT